MPNPDPDPLQVSEFKNRFVNPIVNGNTLDASAADVRLSRQRMAVLHQPELLALALALALTPTPTLTLTLTLSLTITLTLTQSLALSLALP